MKPPYIRAMHVLLVVIAVLALSGCGLFRKGCKCPPVHRHAAAVALR